MPTSASGWGLTVAWSWLESWETRCRDTVFLVATRKILLMCVLRSSVLLVTTTTCPFGNYIIYDGWVSFNLCQL